MPKLKDAGPNGPFVTGLLNVLSILQTPWGVLMGTVLAGVIIAWKWAREVLATQEAAVFGGLWLLFFWTWIGLRVLAAQGKPREVVTVWDCAFCIALENFTIGHDPTSPEAAFQVIVTFRNLGNGPIRLLPEEFRVQIGDRVAPEPPPRTETIIPRLSTKGVGSGSFRKDAVPDKGTADFTLGMKYGRHDGEFTRRFRLKAAVNFRIENGEIKGASGGIISETDEPI